MEPNTALLSPDNDYLRLFDANRKKLTQNFPSFLVELRKEALESFRMLGIPGKKNENYKYIDLPAYFNNTFRKELQPKNITFNIEDIFRCDIPELDADVILVLNGIYYDTHRPMRELEGGILAGSLAEAFRLYPGIVEKHFGKYADHRKDGLIALNTALATDGFFLYVPDGIRMKRPIQVINLLMSDEPTFSQQRNLLVLGRGASASLVVCDHTLSAEKFLSNNLTEVFTAKDSRFEITRLQNEHNASTQVLSQFYMQEANSLVNTNTITLHGGMVRNNLFVQLSGEGAENNAYGLFITDQGQHVDNYTFVDHAVAHCNSNQLFKGVLDDFSSGAFNGRILVRKDAQKTVAYQKNNNLLLTSDARINTKPQLEIYADDVKCSHGAAVGQLDKQAMFYLQSRGIGRDEARQLLMNAFANEIIAKIQVEPIRERIAELVGKRLRGELSRCHNCAMHCC